MTKLYLILGLLLITFHANADAYTQRVQWIKQLKVFLSTLEKEHPEILETKQGHSLVKKWQLLESAWASNNYDCFYAGWPSKLTTYQGRKLCQSPSRKNTEYKGGNCKAEDLQCQPLLFGAGLCVGFKNPEDKRLAFSKCEKKFQVERKGNYDFIKNFSHEEIEALKEISHLAGEVCEKGSIGIQASSPMCKNLMKSIPHGLNSLEVAPAIVSQKKVVSKLTRLPPRFVNVAIPNIQPPSEEVCVEPNGMEDIVHVSHKMIESATHQVDSLYEDFKKDFLSSPLCEPQKVIHDPKALPNAIVLARLIQDMDSYLNHTAFGRGIDLYLKSLDVSDSIINKVTQLLSPAEGKTMNIAYWANDLEFRQRRKMAEVLIVQSFAKKLEDDPSFMSELIPQGLVEKGIFQENEEGEAVCPFVSQDAFRKAIMAHENALKKGVKGITNKQQLTIVDYSMPSNQRRLFVLDLEKKIVLHNTWSAHGKIAEGSDGLGGTPEFSNVSGSGLSSDGLILASHASRGARFGDNVILKGIDRNNTKMQARAVILHQWGAPMSPYASGEDLQNLKSINDGTWLELERVTSRMRGVLTTDKYMNATEGCLGVPTTSVKHLDRKNRSEKQLEQIESKGWSQVEVLRQDLPGSLIFSYSGESMVSNYF